jgi:uncharacterized radical SAM superfamily protein
MIECTVHMLFPLTEKEGDREEATWTPIAKYQHDIRLVEKEEFFIHNLHFGGHNDEPFDFTARVVKLDKIVNPQRGEDLFKINIYVELADREKLEEIKEILRRYNPGKFE